MKKLSVKGKITLWFASAMLLVAAALLFTMQNVLDEVIARDIEERVIQTVDNAARQMPRPMRRGSTPGSMHDDTPPVPDIKFYGQGVHMVLYDETDAIIGGQVPFDIEEMPAFSDKDFRRIAIDGVEFCFYDREVTTPGGHTLRLRGVASMEESRFAGVSLLKTNFILVAILILLATLGGYLILRRAFVPVDKIRHTAEEIMESGDLSRRIALPKGKDEIAALAGAFDEMLDKIEDSFHREQQFTSDASHELRTPIAVILSECEYMTDCAATSEEYKEAAAVVSRQAERMSRLVSELLTLSRMDKNTLTQNFEETDISELLAFVCDEQLEIHGETPALTREIAPGLQAKADRFLLARLFINLIENAYRYTPADGKIAVRLVASDEKITFSVEDSGIGIAKADIPKIWGRFYQVDPARSEKEGSMGLGLSMVKWIAACHDGEVTVESTVGKGSTFTFSFPTE